MKPSHPQRIVPSSPFGTLFKATQAPLRRLLARETAASDPTYLAAIRACPCLRCGLDPAGEAAHVRSQSGAFNKRSAMGKKPDDKFALPLCASCHRLDRDAQHAVGETAFWHFVGLNPLLVCQRLYERRGDLVAMRAVIFSAVGERRALGA